LNKEFENCIEKRGLKKESRNTEMINKELNEADKDLETATDSFENKAFKWCIIQSYYAIFHAAKALVLSKGYREKSHYCYGLIYSPDTAQEALNNATEFIAKTKEILKSKD
jgi:uncharacterized protein (UPF0332 family)